MAIAREPMTLEDFLKLPEAKPALEYEDGRITQKAWPGGSAQRALQGGVTEIFNRAGRLRQLWFAFLELRSTYQSRSYVPDVAVYRWERIPRTPDGRVADDFTIPPDVAIEIVSPEQSANALVRKCLWYVANGSGAALLLDPGDKSALLFRPDAVPQVLAGEDRIELGEVLPGFGVTVKELFDTLRID